MDRIDCLRAFVRVMEGGSFSTAARELAIGQPAVSKRIAMLEAEFGAQLFLRTSRRLRPTPEAERIYDLAQQILGGFEQARVRVAEAAPRPSGTLRVSLPSSFGRRFLMPLVAEYVRDHPEVRLDLRFSERFVNLVEDGIELAVRIGNLQSSSLVARRLGTMRRHLVASPTYLHGRPVPRTPEDLAAHHCIVYSRISPAGEWCFESEHGRHVVHVQGPVIVDDADAMQDAVLRHLGIAVLPEWNAADGLRSGELEAVLPDYSVASLPLHAVHPEMQWMSLRARSFLDLLVRRSASFAGPAASEAAFARSGE